MTRILDVSKFKWQAATWKSPQGTLVPYRRLAVYTVWDKRLKTTRLCNLWHADYATPEPFDFDEYEDQYQYVSLSRWKAKYKIANVKIEGVAAADYGFDLSEVIPYQFAAITPFPDVPIAEFEASPMLYLFHALQRIERHKFLRLGMIYNTLRAMDVLESQMTYDQWITQEKWIPAHD